MAGRQEAAPSGVRGLNSIRRPLPSQGERASLSDEQHSEADGSDWERVSVNGSVCGSASEAGDDAIDALVEDFQDVGFPTIGEESTSAGWDRLPEYDATLARRPTTPSSLGDDKSLAELLCQGPFASRRPRSSTRGRNLSFHSKRQQWRVTTSGSGVPMAAASAPASK